MAFDYAELEPHEIALLALEYLKSNAHWLEQAAAECGEGEVSRVLTEVAAQTHDFANELDVSIAEHFSGRTRNAEAPSRRLNRPPDLLEAEQGDLSAEELLEAATAEHEESYQFFLQEANEVEEDWVREMFERLSEHARRVVVVLEEERERILDEDV